MKIKRTEQNSPGFVEVPSDKLWSGVNRQMVDGPAQDVYEIRPRKDGDGVDLISDRLRRGPIWYTGPDAVRNAVAYAKYRSRSRSHRSIIRVLDHFGALIEMHESRRQISSPIGLLKSKSSRDKMATKGIGNDCL